MGRRTAVAQGEESCFRMCVEVLYLGLAVGDAVLLT